MADVNISFGQPIEIPFLLPLGPRTHVEPVNKAYSVNDAQYYDPNE
jgi:hypothetical protein